MITDFIISTFGDVFNGFLQTVGNAVPIPLSAVNVLSTITGFGAWIVGSDLLLQIAGCIMWWSVLKLGLGVILFIWRLLPLT